MPCPPGRWTRAASSRSSGSPDDVTSCRSLADLPAADLAAALGLIAGRLTTVWNPEPPRPSPLPIAAVLRDQMGCELGSHGSIRAWARRARLLADETPWLSLPDEPAACPNPLLLSRDTAPLGGRTAEILTGRCHGDLHLLNVLLPRRPGGPLRPDDFLLVDLGGYRRSRPVTTDPAFLMLSAVARGLRGLTPRGRQELLDHLVDPGATRPDGHLAEAVDRVGDTVTSGRWSEELRFQLRLSVIGAATQFTSFADLGPGARWWFFRLAARLGRELLGDLEVRTPGRAPLASNPFQDPPGRVPLAANPFPDSPAPAPAVRSPAARRPAAAGPVGREVALAWRAALTDPAEAGRHLDAAYERSTRDADPATVTRAVVRDLVDDATQILGAADPATLRLRHRLAGWTHRAGDAVTALAMYRRVAAARARVLGPDHPDTVESERCAGWPPLLDDAAHQAYGT